MGTVRTDDFRKDAVRIALTSPANIFFNRRFPSSLAQVWAIIEASIPPYFARHLQNDAFPLSDCRQSPAGQWHHAMLAAPLSHRHAAFSPSQDHDDQFIGACAAPSGATVPASSMYLLVFIQNLHMHLAEKIPLIQPLTFGADYRLPSDVVGQHREVIRDDQVVLFIRPRSVQHWARL